MSLETPILFVIKGCPYCREAVDYLAEHKIQYQTVEVRNDPAAFKRLMEVSGQAKTPTLVWDKHVLANFGIEELEPFLKKHQ